MHRKFQLMGNLRPLLYQMSACGIYEPSFQICQILSSTPKSWYLPPPLVPFTLVEPSPQFSLEYTCLDGISACREGTCCQITSCAQFLIREIAYGGRRKPKPTKNMREETEIGVQIFITVSLESTKHYFSQSIFKV